MKDRYRDDQPSKPNAGVAAVHGKKFEDRDDTPSAANAGGTPREDKAAHDQKHGRSGLSQPNAGPHDRGKDPKNISKPEGGDAPIPQDRLHLDKVRAHAEGIHEPKPAKGAKYPDGSKTTKVK